MNDGILVFLSIFITALWCIFGVGTITLLRAQKISRLDSLPKVCAVAWPLFLALAAFGLFDESSS